MTPEAVLTPLLLTLKVAVLATLVIGPGSAGSLRDRAQRLSGKGPA